MTTLRAILALSVAAFLPSADVTNAGEYVLSAGITCDLVQPKARVRDGTPERAGDNVFSGPVLNLDSEVPSATLWFGVRHGADRLLVTTWRGSARGANVLDGDIAYSGKMIPAGTHLDSEEEWSGVRAQYMHSFGLARNGSGRTWLSLGIGAAVDRTTFRADLDWGEEGGGTYLTGVFPTLQAAVDLDLTERVGLTACMGGFHLPTTRNGDTAVLAPVEYRLALKCAWGHLTATAGYYLYHVHFERDMDAVEEDVVHLRLRSTYLGVGYTF